MFSRNRIVVFVVVGIILAVVGMGVLYFAIQPALTARLTPPTPEAPLSESVLVAARDLPVGVVLTESDIATVDVPVQFIPRNALRNLGNAVGRFTRSSLIEGEMLLEHHLADPTNVSHDLAFILSDDHVLMALHPRDLMSDLTIVQRGDIIDIFVSANIEDVELNAEGGEETTAKLYTFDALQRVSVTAMVVEILQGDGSSAPSVFQPGSEEEIEEAPSESRVLAYLIALNPQNALVLKHLRDAGATFDLVLRSPTNSSFFELDTVDQEYIKEKYGLGISP